MSLSSLSTRRRGFLATLAAGAGTVAAGIWSRADAETLVTAAGEEAWVGKLHGKYRQVFDVISANEGFGVAFALNFVNSTKSAQQAADADISAVVVMRHMAMPLALNDATWAKYKIGEVIGVMDPKTKKPATRNPFWNNIPIYTGLDYSQVVTKYPVTIVACSMALAALSGMAAPKAGVSADAAKKDWMAGLLPGIVTSASGVYAVNRAQNAGGCSYCFAG